MNTEYKEQYETDEILNLLIQLNSYKYDKNLNFEAVNEKFSNLMILMKFKKLNLPFKAYTVVDKEYLKACSVAYLYVKNFIHLSNDPKIYNRYKKELIKICSKINNYCDKQKTKFIYNDNFFFNYPFI